MQLAQLRAILGHTTESTKSSDATIDVYFEPSHTHEKNTNDDAESTAHGWP